MVTTLFVKDSIVKYSLFILLAAMTTLDGALTIMYVKVWGLGAELNPFIRWAMEAYGIYAVLWVKVAALVFLFVLLPWIRNRVLCVLCGVHLILLIYWSIVL